VGGLYKRWVNSRPGSPFRAYCARVNRLPRARYKTNSVIYLPRGGEMPRFAGIETRLWPSIVC